MQCKHYYIDKKCTYCEHHSLFAVSQEIVIEGKYDVAIRGASSEYVCITCGLPEDDTVHTSGKSYKGNLIGHTFIRGRTAKSTIDHSGDELDMMRYETEQLLARKRTEKPTSISGRTVKPETQLADSEFNKAVENEMNKIYKGGPWVPEITAPTGRPVVYLTIPRPRTNSNLE